jgi:4-hydroxy-3-polyprenylbenzoate decarboxylase
VRAPARAWRASSIVVGVRLIVGMSGASGAIYGIRLLEILSDDPRAEVHLILTPAARQTITIETDYAPADVEKLADVTYKYGDVAAAPSSGSFPVDAMLIVPCSVRTAASIAWALDENLLVRAADVTLKERRRLIVALRELPLHLGHLRTLVQLAEIGAIVAPLAPSFYSRPRTIDDLVGHTVGRLLDLIGLEPPEGLVRRWQGAGPSLTVGDDRD